MLKPKINLYLLMSLKMPGQVNYNKGQSSSDLFYVCEAIVRLKLQEQKMILFKSIFK